MNIPGHIAVAVATDRALNISQGQARSGFFLLVSSLFPDVSDKIIGHIFHLMPNGRNFAHNIFAWSGSALLVGLIWGRSAGRAWLVGYGGHLLADSDKFMPWFFPLKSYNFPNRRTFIWERESLLWEAVLLLLALIYHRISA